MKTINLAQPRLPKDSLPALAVLMMALATFTPARANFDNDNDGDDFTFNLVRSAAAVAANALPNAQARVHIQSVGPVEIMEVKVWGLPANTDFDFFVIQVPNAPFGLSWYQGDIETNSHGVGFGRFIGRFSIETFIVAPGVAPAPPDPFHDPNRIPDATQNPATNPVQTYHLGLWFNSPNDAVKAGLPGTVTTFNGEHDAGVQALSTRQFPDAAGPLNKITTSGN